MTSVPPPLGIPFGPPVSFDAVMVAWATGTILVLAALGLLLWVMRQRSRASYILPCPRSGRTATVVVHTKRGGGPKDIEHCSLWTSGKVDCERRCLHMMA